jgi:hypothetical protein
MTAANEAYLTIRVKFDPEKHSPDDIRIEHLGLNIDDRIISDPVLMGATYDPHPFKDVPDYLPTEDEVCCQDMHHHLRMNADCEQHGWNCPDRAIGYQKDGSYLLYADNACYSIDNCPWCGGSLNSEPQGGIRLAGFDIEENNDSC